MELLVEGAYSLHSLGYNPSSVVAANRSPRPLRTKYSRYEGATSTSSATVVDYGINVAQTPLGSVSTIPSTSSENMDGDGMPDSSKLYLKSNKDNLKFVHKSEETVQEKLNCSQKSSASIDDSANFDSSSLVEAADYVLAAEEVAGNENKAIPSKVGVGCKSPQNSTTIYESQTKLHQHRS